MAEIRVPIARWAERGRKVWNSVSDSALAALSPRRATMRAHLRRMNGDYDYRETFLTLMRARGYKSAKSGGQHGPWLGSTGSADAEISHDLPAMRSRLRELDRDDPIASGLVGTFVKNVIGKGMRPQARTKDPEKNARIEAVWKARKDNLSQADDATHNETQEMLFARVLEDGDVLRNIVKLKPSDPVWFETIEGDRLVTPLNKVGKLKNGNEIRDGVEKDPQGRPVRYHILNHHPGDTVLRVDGNSATAFTTIEKQFIRHLKFMGRPGQTRGVPFMHAILQDLRDLDLLILASLKRVQIAACLSVFIKSSGEMPDMLDVTAEQHGYALDQTIEPGMMFKLYPDEEIQTLVPNFPTPELAPFIIMLARRIGAALGVSWQIVLKDFGDSTYSSARTDLLESRITYTVMQNWFAEKYLNWEWMVVLQDARLNGDKRLSDVTDEELGMVQWIAQGWKWVDPLKEAKATEVELNAGITTHQKVAAERGDEWEEILVMNLEYEKREIELRAEMGLPPKTPPSDEDKTRKLLESAFPDKEDD